MTGKTHIMGGIASCTAAAYYYGFDPVLMAASGAVGALIPDICHTQSKIGRKFPILSKVVSSVLAIAHLHTACCLCSSCFLSLLHTFQIKTYQPA